MTARFHIIARADPQALMRVLGLFAQRSLVPQMVSSRAFGDALEIEIVINGLDHSTVQVIASKIDALFLVLKVWLEPGMQASFAGQGTVVRRAA